MHKETILIHQGLVVNPTNMNAVYFTLSYLIHGILLDQIIEGCDLYIKYFWFLIWNNRPYVTYSRMFPMYISSRVYAF